MAAQQNDNDEDDKQRTPRQPAQGAQEPREGGMGGGTNAQPTYPFQRNFQTPQGPATTPGQQTAMPWSQMAPGLANFGRSATPWAQTLQAPQMPQQGQQAAPQGMPNWQALTQRFGGGNGQAPSPAFQQPRFQPPWMQSAQGGAAGGGGFQLPPWLQQAAQAIAARGGGGFQLPGFGGPQGATPSWGGGMAMPNWGGAQGLPIFNQPRNTY